MKKFLSVLIAAMLMLTAFTVSTYAENLNEGDFSIDITGSDNKILVDWDDYYNAPCYKVSITTDVEYHCAEGVVTESSYDWYADYNVTPNEVFSVTVYAYDSTGSLIAQSDTVQLYIVTQLCDYFGYYGDIDGDQSPSVIDATVLQNYLARSSTFNAMQERLADVDCDGKLTVMDATFIQQFCAAIYNPENRTNESFALGWVEYNVNFDQWWEN